MDKIIVTVDLGHLKAYKVSRDPLERESLTLIDSYDSMEGHGRLSEKLSDSAGRFTGGGGRGDVVTGYGEPHNLELDIEKKIIKSLAKDINDLIARENASVWYLAAAGKINRQILDQLAPGVKAKLGKNIKSDLTKTNKSEILSHFK